MPAETIFPLAGKRIWVAGHRGMVGSAIVRRLATERCEVLTVDRGELDLIRQDRVEAWLDTQRPHAVFVAAGTVGGIHANDSRPVDFLYDNVMIAANVVAAAHAAGVEKLLFLGSSCIYPRDAGQPIAEDALLSGPLEPTNQWYAVAKIAGIKLVQAYRRQHGADYIAAMPTNLYGRGDNYNLQTGHVLPALIRKAHDAKRTGADHIVLWGSGRPRREFLDADDCADACVFLMQRYSGEDHVNIGSGADIAIADLAALVCRIVGFEGDIVQDHAKPDGTPRKLLNSDRLGALGWSPKTQLEAGIARAYRDFLADGVTRGLTSDRVEPA